MNSLLAKTLAVAALLAAAAGAALAAPAAYTVVLAQESGAVAAARARAAGNPLSEDQLESYRDAVWAGQNDFLTALGAAGISHAVSTAALPDFSGALTTVELRTTLVLNSVTLLVEPQDAETIATWPEVKRVERVRMLETSLDNAVDYVRAPAVYGAVAELTAFDDLREGYEGQGMKIAVIDTGIDWSHEMFGGDPTPPRHGLAPSTAATNSNEKVIYYLSFLEN